MKCKLNLPEHERLAKVLQSQGNVIECGETCDILKLTAEAIKRDPVPVLKALGLRRLLSEPTPPPEEARCSHTKLPVVGLCLDRNCPHWCNNKDFNHCVNVYRTKLLGSSDQPLTARDLAILFPVSANAVMSDLSEVLWDLQKIVLKQKAEPSAEMGLGPAWTEAIEQDFQLPVCDVAYYVGISTLAKQYGLSAPQVAVLKDLVANRSPQHRRTT